jgi:DMSO/TMAO reductase YedYZ heme-binding membrane subunit
MTLWYTARGAGLAALVLLSAATALGALASMPSRDTGRRVVLQYAHRSAALLGVVLITMHVTAIVLDPDAHVGLLSALVPFTSGYRPQWVGLGTIALYLMLMVAALGAARGRLASSARAVRIWRGLHALSYGAWALALLHGLESGTDVGMAWTNLVFLGCVLAVVASVGARLVSVARGGLVRTAMEVAR